VLVERLQDRLDVRVAPSAAAALALLRDAPAEHEVVVWATNPAGVAGQAHLAAARRAAPRAASVVLGGVLDGPASARAVASGLADRSVSTPASPHDVVSAVHAALRRRAQATTRPGERLLRLAPRRPEAPATAPLAA
jgi:DNA-binding NarL/FixJ family response regulator